MPLIAKFLFCFSLILFPHFSTHSFFTDTNGTSVQENGLMEQPFHQEPEGNHVEEEDEDH